MPGTWQNLTNQPSAPVQRMLLLTDGSVLCHTGGANWTRYFPDESGQYLAGRWRVVDSMHHARRNFSAVTLANGQVLVMFGSPSYATGTVESGRADFTMEFFNPWARAGRQWTMQTASPGWPATEHAKTHCCILADGRRILVGSDALLGAPSDYGAGHQSSLFDVATNRWTLVDRGIATGCDEQVWTLLPDASVFATNCRPDFRYIPDAGRGRWVPAGSAIYSDVYIPFEGPGVLLPDGRVWVVSQLGSQTKFYTPPTAPGDPGSWSEGPELPGPGGAWESTFQLFGACVLPSGKVLFTGNHAFEYYAQFYEMDPSAESGQVTRTPHPDVEHLRTYSGESGVMLLLPTGQVLMSYASRMFLYTPNPADAPPRAEWRPRMNNISDGQVLVPGGRTVVRGPLLNGMTQAVFHNAWKNSGTATNFPIIRLKHHDTGRVWYCPTHSHSSMGVATGTTVQNTTFELPVDVPQGTADLCIIANGIVGHCIPVVIGQNVQEITLPKEVWQLIGNLADGPLFILGPGGIRPVPPFGPVINEKLARARIVNAYQRILTGLMQMNAATSYQVDEKNGATFTRNEELRANGIKQIEYGIQMLRKIGDQAESKAVKVTSKVKK